MGWVLIDGTMGDNFAMSEEDGSRRLVLIDRTAAEDAFPKESGQGARKLAELLQRNAEAIIRIATAKFAAGGGFRPSPNSRLRVKLSAVELTSSGEKLVQDVGRP
jgi:hypothetical protein